MPASNYIAGAIAFSLTKKVIVLSSVHLYGVGRLYRHLLKAGRASGGAGGAAGPTSAPPPWETSAARSFKHVARLPNRLRPMLSSLCAGRPKR